MMANRLIKRLEEGYFNDKPPLPWTYQRARENAQMVRAWWLQNKLQMWR